MTMPAKTTDSKSPAKGAAPKDLTGTKIGVVESSKRAKTRRVVVAYQSMHPKYGKYLGQRTILQVHDEKNVSKTGDVVEVAACRPVSKTKTWTLVRIVESKSAQAEALASAKEIK
jgi:small subunit ribosomal protein S17